MTFRTKLLLMFTVTVVAAVALVAWGVTLYTRRAFEEMDTQRTDALVAQFRQEFRQRGEEVVRRVEGIADAEATLRMAIELSRPQADPSLYVNDALGLANSHQLDFLELVNNDDSLISSAQWPARFGYKEDWTPEEKIEKTQGAFLRREELPDGAALSLTAVRAVPVSGRNLYIVGGQRLDKQFLASLALPAGMRVLLYQNLQPSFTAAALTDATGPVTQADLIAPIVEQMRKKPESLVRVVQWSNDPASAEAFHTMPLMGRKGELLGVLLVGSSRRGMVTLLDFIRSLALLVGGVATVLAIFVSWWVSARVTRPVKQLAGVAREVAAGNWSTRAKIRSRDEIGQLAATFNEMTRQLVEQRERLVQAERVAAWRELARRLAHELKNPLFPLQITVENLQRARAQRPEQFDEIFQESTATLRAELQNLNAIVGRFSDFAKMPAPRLQAVDVNEAVRDAIRLFEPQFSAVGRPSITSELYLDEALPAIQADPDLLRRALQNLMLNSMDAMPAGGTLTIRTRNHSGAVRVEVSDTGSGLTQGECARLFTPYYTTKQHGTGLGLAIVQSVVSDHGGTIAVESQPGLGTTFRIDLPLAPPPPADGHQAS